MTTEQADVLFASFDTGAGACGRPPRAASIALSDTSYLALLTRAGDDAVVAAVRALGVRVRPYRAIPVLECEASAEQAQRIASLTGVEQVMPALGALEQSRTYANGIDVLLNIARSQHSGAEGVLFPGRRAGDPEGCPVFSREQGLALDDTLDWPIPPALVPVVNLSAGPASPEFPHLLNDIVNLATWGALNSDVLLVLAAGNCGERGPGSVSAWARAPWVLSVGATEDEDGTTLASYSATGVADVPDSGPDVVTFGRSALPPHPAGTSFAAPRVTFLARLVVAAICQLGREVRIQLGAEPHGVPLVGCGIIDRFDAEIWSAPRELSGITGLPVLGVRGLGVTSLLAVAERAGVALDVRGTAEMVRSLLLRAARPMPGYGPHQVGAGFLDQAAVVAQLAALTGQDILSLFGSGPADDLVARDLAAVRVFEAAGLDDLAAVLSISGPMFVYDHPGQRVAARPLHPDDVRALPIFERTLGVAAPPLPLA